MRNESLDHQNRPQDHRNHPQDHQNRLQHHQNHTYKEFPKGGGLLIGVVLMVLEVVLVVLKVALVVLEVTGPQVAPTQVDPTEPSLIEGVSNLSLSWRPLER